MDVNKGQALIELILAIAITTVFLVALTTGIISAREGFARGSKHLEANSLIQKESEVIRSIRETGWDSISTAGVYHTEQSGNDWTLTPGTITEGSYTRSFSVANVCREESNSTPINCNSPQALVDPSTKQVTVTVSWSFLGLQSLSSTFYLTRYFGNQSWIQTTVADFNQGTLSGTAVTNNSGGEVQLDFTPPQPPSCLEGYWQDPQICDTYNVAGADDGRGVFVDGNYAYMVTNSSLYIFNITDPENVSLAGSVGLGAIGYNIFVSGNYAYIATSHNSRELTVVNITNKATPALVGTGYNAAGTTDGYGVFVSGNTAYLSRQSGTGADFFVLNISNPLSPSLLDSIDLGSSGFDVFVSENYAYLATSNNSRELDIIDVSTQTNINRVGSYDTAETTDGLSVYVSGTTAYLTTTSGGADFYAINVSNPSSPSLLDSIDLGGSGWKVYVDSGLAFVGTSNGTAEFQVIDISDPSNLILFGTENLNGQTYSVFIVGDFAYLGNVDDTAEFQVLNGGDPPVGGASGCPGSWQNPQVCKTYNTPGGDGRSVFVKGDYAYMVSGSGSNDFYIFNISDPENFLLEGSLTMGTTANNVYVSGNYAYVSTTDDNREMIVVDISNKSSPTVIGVYNTPGTPNGYGVFVKGPTAYLTTGGTGDDLFILDVSNPASPTLLGSMDLAGIGYDMMVSGNYAYIATSNNSRELDVIDISDPTNPTRIGSFNTPGTVDGLAIYIVGSTTYLTTQSSTNEFYILDVSSVSSISQIGALDLGANGNDVFADGDFAFIATSNTASELQVIDISNPSTPSLYGFANLNGTSFGVSAFGDYAIIGNADNAAEFQLIKGGALYTGSFISSVFDAGSNVAFNHLTWVAALPPQTNVRFQLATNNNGSTWNFGGPDGTRTTFYTSPGAVALNSVSARYARYKIFLSSDVNNVSPVIQDVTLNYSP